MVVAIVCCELHLPASGSLKSKRRVVRSVVERLHARYRVSTAETDYHDLHQRAEVGIAVVGQREGELRTLVDELRREVESEPEAEIIAWDEQFLEGAA